MAKRKKRKDREETVIKTVLAVLPVRHFDEELDCFILDDGSCMDMLQIIPRDVNNLSADELRHEIYDLIRAYKTVGSDLKLVSMNFPLNTDRQQKVLRHHREKAGDAVRRMWIERQIGELETVDENIHTSNFYLFYFGRNEDELLRNRENIDRYMCTGYERIAEHMIMLQRMQILVKLCNMNNTYDIHYYDDEVRDKNNEKNNKTAFKQHQAEETDPAYLDEKLFAYIQPKGGITFKEPSYVQTGDGYIRCLHVYEFPNMLNNFWIKKIYNLTDTVCTIDINTRDLATVKRNINRSIGEESARYAVAKNHMERYDATKRVQELQALYNQLESMGEVIKTCDFRIFVKDRTLAGLEEKCEKIVHEIEGDSFRITTLLNEQKQEWRSMFTSYSKAHQVPFAMKGLSLTSEQLGIGYPFNYSELLDDQGTLLGFSETGGVVLFDEFTKTAKRQHYNSLAVGAMGSGKSTFLKKRFKHHASLDNFVRCFDVSGEFGDLTREFGGKIIKCNGNEGMLNPLEILRSGEDDGISFAKHITRMQTFYKCVVPTLTDIELQSLANQLRGLYEAWGLVPQEGVEITGRDPKEYPVFSEFIEYLSMKLERVMLHDARAMTDVETTLNVREAETLKNILTITENLIKNYGYIFDGHTSIADITNEKIVTFDISGIKHLGNIFTAQMQNLVSLCWDNAVKNGVKQKELWETGSIPTQDITKFYMIIDESHEWVNTRMPHILDMIITYMREARKYFAGITLASQSIRDYMPEESYGGTDKIKMLFELSQYVFMFKQPSSTLPHIRSVFGDSLTYSQIDGIPFLEQGQTVLAIQGDRSIKFTVWLSKAYEESLFKGGR